MPKTLKSIKSIRALTVGKAGSGGGGGVFNLVPPSLSGVPYPAGAYTAYPGAWSDGSTAAMTLQVSATGSDPWSDVGPIGTAGTFASGASLASKYVRIDAVTGGVHAYSTPMHLGPNYDQVLDTSGNNNYLSKTITAPFLGLNMAAGEKLLFLASTRYPGSGLETGAAIMSIGDVNSGTIDMSMMFGQTQFRDGGAGAWANSGSAIVGSRWYLAGSMFSVLSGSTFKSTSWVNTTKAEATQSGSINVSHYTTFRLLKTANNSTDNAENYDLPVAWFFWAKVSASGNPDNLIAWCYNNGDVQRNPWDYPDLATDGITNWDYSLATRVSPGNTTFSASELDSAGGTITGWTQAGSLAWTNKLPGFINPAGDPPTTPAVYTLPDYFVEAGTTVTLCSNTVAPGAANPSLFTYTSIVHSVTGAMTVTGGTITPTQAGTITFTNLAYNGGTARTFTMEVLPALSMAANPQFRTLYNGNARAASIEVYPSPGAGTVYATGASLKSAIEAAAPGATLIVADSDLSSYDLTGLTAKDFGNVTITATNRHGLKLNSVDLSGVVGLVFHGIEAINGFSFSSIPAGSITLKHCRGRKFSASGNPSSSKLFVENWVGYDDGTNSQCTITNMKRLQVDRFAHSNIDRINGADNIHWSVVDEVIGRFWCVGENHVMATANNPDPHLDNAQSYGSGASGVTRSFFRYIYMPNTYLSGDAKTEGLFLTGVYNQSCTIDNVIAVPTLGNAIIVGQAQQGISITNSFGQGTFQVQSDSLTYSAYAKDNIVGGYGNVLASASLGTEIGTVTGVSVSTIYPQYSTYAGTWEAFDNPAPAYATKGPYQFVAMLAASKSAYP